MTNMTRSDSDVEGLVKEYARSLGLTDERAVAAALHRMETGFHLGTAAALEEACALLRSWWRHPSHQAVA